MKHEITIRGLVNELDNGICLWEEVYERWYEDKITDYTKNKISQYFIDNDYLRVHPKLQDIVGVYDLSAANDVLWKDEYIESVLRVCLDYEANRCNKQPMLQTILLKLEMYKTLLQADFVTGYTTGKRQEKILRYTVKMLNKIYTIPSHIIMENYRWYKLYESRKSSDISNYKLVITNSIASQLGMSSYAPKRGNRERTWSSCQKIASNAGGCAFGLPSNLMDENSIIAYVTSGNPVEFFGMNENSFMHHEMESRLMLRLLKDEKGDLCLAPDRFYPNTQFAPSVMPALKEICNKNNIKLVIFNDYNSSQNEDNYDFDDIIFGGDYIAKTIFPAISVQMRCQHICNNNGQYCGRCSNRGTDVCKHDCNDCKYRTCNEQQMYYLDQNIFNWNKCYDEYTFDYCVYNTHDDIKLFTEMKNLQYDLIGKKVQVRHWYETIKRIGYVTEVSDYRMCVYIPEMNTLHRGNGLIVREDACEYIDIDSGNYEIIEEEVNNEQKQQKQ